MSSGPRIALVGATGLVGRTALALLEERVWLRRDPLLYRGDGSAVSLPWRGREIPVAALDPAEAAGCDGILLCGGAAASRRHAPELALHAVVVDNSSAWRMDPAVPLLLAPLHADRLRDPRAPRLLANPNCTAAIAGLALAPLRALAAWDRVSLVSYQSASGGGQPLLDRLDHPSRDLPPPLRENVWPWIDGPDAVEEGGDSGEEAKIVAELRRLLELPDWALSATAVRVPTRVGHGVALTLWAEEPCGVERAREALAAAPGVELCPVGTTPTPRDAAGRDPVLVGRIRRPAGDPRALCLWVVGDNLRRGAALNAVELLEARLGLGGSA